MTASPSDPPRADPPRTVPPAAAQRGLKHWMIIGAGAAFLIIVFLLCR
jgi:hypothetical protein